MEEDEKIYTKLFGKTEWDAAPTESDVQAEKYAARRDGCESSSRSGGWTKSGLEYVDGGSELKITPSTKRTRKDDDDRSQEPGFRI